MQSQNTPKELYETLETMFRLHQQSRVCGSIGAVAPSKTKAGIHEAIS